MPLNSENERNTGSHSMQFPAHIPRTSPVIAPSRCQALERSMAVLQKRLLVSKPHQLTLFWKRFPLSTRSECTDTEISLRELEPHRKDLGTRVLSLTVSPHTSNTVMTLMRVLIPFSYNIDPEIQT